MSDKKQNFFRGQRVKISDELPEEMKHFEKGCEAIVVASYSDDYSVYDDINEYELLLLLPEPEIAAWYPEDRLTLVSDDRIIGEQILQGEK